MWIFITFILPKSPYSFTVKVHPMKTTFIVLVCLLYTKLLLSQAVFCPPGAEWHYNFAFYTINPSSGYVKSNSNERIKYVRDSVLGSITTKVISHNYFFKGSCNASHAPLTLIKQNGDTIFMRNIRTHHKWQILYNFAAQPGDSWTDSLYSDANVLKVFTFKVDSISMVNINGFNLKCLYSYPYTITERIGANSFLFNFNTFSCDGVDYDRFLCYQDSSFGMKQFTSYPCDYSNPVGIEKASLSTKSVKIFPNPANDWFAVEGEFLNGNEEIILTDLLGREVKKALLTHYKKIDVKDLNSGVFFISILKDKEVVCKSTFIKG